MGFYLGGAALAALIAFTISESLVVGVIVFYGSFALIVKNGEKDSGST